MQYLTVFLEYSWLSWIILQYLEHLKFATYQYPSFTLCLRNTERPQKTQHNRSCRTCDIAASWGQPLGRIWKALQWLLGICHIVVHIHPILSITFCIILPNLNCYLSRPASALSWSKYSRLHVSELWHHDPYEEGIQNHGHKLHLLAGMAGMDVWCEPRSPKSPEDL